MCSCRSPFVCTTRGLGPRPCQNNTTTAWLQTCTFKQWWDRSNRVKAWGADLVPPVGDWGAPCAHTYESESLISTSEKPWSTLPDHIKVTGQMCRKLRKWGEERLKENERCTKVVRKCETKSVAGADVWARELCLICLLAVTLLAVSPWLPTSPQWHLWCSLSGRTRTRNISYDRWLNMSV